MVDLVLKYDGRLFVQRKRPGHLFVDQKVESGLKKSGDETHHNQVAHLGHSAEKFCILTLGLGIPLMGRVVYAIASNWIKSKPTIHTQIGYLSSHPRKLTIISWL